MTLTRVAALSALLFCCAGPAGAQSVKLEFNDGQVNLTTQNASLRAILAEWARLGGTQVVNGERMAGAPVTLELDRRPGDAGARHHPARRRWLHAGQRAAAGPAGARSTLDRILIRADGRNRGARQRPPGRAAAAAIRRAAAVSAAAIRTTTRSLTSARR